MVKKALTFKSGNFPFSALYNKKKIQPLLLEAQLLYRAIAQIPVLPRITARIEEELIKKSIFGTAAIEGNPLPEEAVEEVLEEEHVKKRKKKSEKQIVNLKNAYKFIRDIKPTEKKISLDEEFVKSINSVITHESEEEDHIPGKYRNHVVHVGDKEHGGKYTPPKMLKDIKMLMQEFVQWINSEDIINEDDAIRAAFTHYHLALIHPFGNGNGRTARVVEAIILKASGIRFVPHNLSNYYYRNIDDYYWAFSLSEKNKDNDITPFLEFYLKGLVESLREIQAQVYSHIRILSLRDYYRYEKNNKSLNKRQYELLEFLLLNPQSFLLNDLYEKPGFRVLYAGTSDRTARRDIKKLLEKKCLRINEQEQFELNFFLLD